MPEQIINKIKKSILPQWKVCFISAMIMGLIAHLYKITNWLPNWDGLVFRYDAQNMISMGRWFLPVVCAPSSFYDLPFIAGLMAIIFHGLGAVCICKMLGVRKNITAALIGAMVATFPTVTSVMMYNYVADGYALAFLFSCIASMLITKDKPCYIGSAILIALSAGIYQAYITVTIMLLLLSLILDLLYKNTDVKKSLLKCVKFLLTGILGMALYYLVMTVLLKFTGTALLEYQGFDNATSLKGIDIAGALYTIKESFVNYFFDFSAGLNVFVVTNCIFFVLTLVLYLTDVIKNKLGIAKILMLCICVILLPIGASVLSFINSGIDYHNLMKMGFLVFYLFFILQYENTSVKLNKVKQWTILVVTAILIFNQIIIANVSYHKLNIAYEKSYGTLIRIADRIEQTEGAGECDSILVLGYLPESEDYSVKLPPDMTGTTDGYILRADDEIVGQSVLCSALNDYCGKNYRFISGQEKSELLKRIDTDNLNNWPAKNSISVIDNVIVVKLGD
ncbi:MAG: glucosyltransferase domain-containing protein [Clostridia bacterium]|nr:glucosyltransferase domain-containing protein [Clostridia bacterium]